MCKFFAFCAFAHSKADIRVELLEDWEADFDFMAYKFKTVECPYQALGQHDYAGCVYFHNSQDRRRPLLTTYYNPQDCQFWY